jgi:hypothetical protein
LLRNSTIVSSFSEIETQAGVTDARRRRGRGGPGDVRRAPMFVVFGQPIQPFT